MKTQRQELNNEIASLRSKIEVNNARTLKAMAGVQKLFEKASAAQKAVDELLSEANAARIKALDVSNDVSDANEPLERRIEFVKSEIALTL